MSTLRFLGICGSLRRASCNLGLLRAAAERVPEGVSLEIADLSDMPFYNADLAAAGKPAAVERVVGQIAAADALVFACTEYNYSIAPALKNAIDWASREPDNRALGGKACAIMGAGGGMGSSRAQYHLRQVCVFVDLHPLNRPEIYARAFGDSFDAEGNLLDAKIQEQIAQQMRALAEWSRKLAGAG